MINLPQVLDSSSDVEPARHHDPADWLRLVAIWSWLHARPHATFQEFLEAIPTIDAFVERGTRK